MAGTVLIRKRSQVQVLVAPRSFPSSEARFQDRESGLLIVRWPFVSGIGPDQVTEISPHRQQADAERSLVCGEVEHLRHASRWPIHAHSDYLAPIDRFSGMMSGWASRLPPSSSTATWTSPARHAGTSCGCAGRRSSLDVSSPAHAAGSTYG